jgi:hypothetical protein
MRLPIRSSRAALIRLALLTLALGSLAACSPVAAEGEEIFTMYVADHTVSCSGEGITTCLLVRRDPAAEWQYFYDGIEGFTYQPGFEYELRVASRPVPNPPADGSSVAYRLLRVVSRK